MLIDIFFPNRCLECNEIISGREVVCVGCLDKIHFTHWDFGDNELKRKAEFLFPLRKSFALMFFEKKGLSRKIIHQLKYKNQEKIGKILALWVVERMDLGGEKPDLLVSVPLHPKKMKERGYNQLHLFTKNLSRMWGIPFRDDLLRRNTYHKAQATKDKTHREKAQNNFSLIENIENKHILLIDDVFTTGNTMSAVVWEVLKEKDNSVSILVLAMEK